MQVYFLCTGNSCRSQMAEGFARKYFPDWTIASAGIEKHGLNQMAVRVMSEKGIDISKNESKLIDVDFLNSSDLVVTLCGDARDKCPMTPPTVKKEHWGFIDPALIQGTENDKLRAFRTVRDSIEKRIIKMRSK
ncbi:arsenate reductase (thioredoxin) [Pediococcus pentosaceus]|uniref:arsenate reductase (thioredoxin) n=1 Tax=Pediococcus pentosaceus TaxID=1255 RepID=UPI0018A13A9B|nr:arsenate reductase (thioredoxin) [Pediococcus pentosaceus]MBF7102169.1 arsenate reductase (thioredoxin) [Pediococcus pentosaceus]MBF7138614.1 arsenate reductase (thioredoxin) [Pediococcus pentosaceus]